MWRLLAQRVMSTVVVIVGQVFISKPIQVWLIQRDYVIGHLAATTSNPALRDSVLPRAPDARANGFNAARLQELDNIAAEFSIPVKDNLPVKTGQRESFAQLLYDPLARRMLRNVEVENAPAAVFDYKETIKHTKRQGWNSKEVKRRNHLSMIVQEGRPALRFALIVVTLQPTQISGYSRLGNLEPQFAMDARCAPARIVRFHAPDQLADLPADLRSSRLAGPRTPLPEQPEAGAMPGHDRFRLHNDQGTGPAGPHGAKRSPEEPIAPAQFGTGRLPLEYRELLPQCYRFQGEFMPRHEKGAAVGDQRASESNH